MKFKNIVLGSIVETENKMVVESLKQNPDYKVMKEPKKKK